MSEEIRRLAAQAPGAAALIEGDRIISRAEADQRIDQFGHVLADRGVRAGDTIAWMMHNRAEVVLLAFAAQRLGAVMVPFSYRSTAREVPRLLALARPAVVVAEAGTRGMLSDAGAPGLLDVDDPAVRAGLDETPRGPVPPPPAASDRLGAGASMLFTSGTTATPKAVVRSRGDARVGKAIFDGFGFGPQSRYLTSGPLYHSGPYTCGLMALSRGGVVGLLPRFRAADWIAFARRHAITATFITPTQLRQVVTEVESGTPAPPALSNLVVSGEPFPAELKRRAVAALGPCLIDCYGSTELGPMTCMPPSQLLDRPTSSGQPFPGVQVAAFDGGTRLEPGRTGLLRVLTPLAFDGYLNGESSFLDHESGRWATVGDVGYVDGEGFVYLSGRSDDLIISGGVNIYPADVEAVLAEHPAVAACAVVGLPDERWGQVACAAVIADRELSLAEVRDWLRGRIADDKRPQRLTRVTELPTTHTDKVSRRALREIILAGG
jgi:acyl-CoA synthetase (AMP-forming)/AMP-acid ligase II